MVCHAPAGEEAGDVEGDGGIQRGYPADHVLKGFGVIVFSGNDQVGQFHVGKGRRFSDGFPHRISGGAADIFVEIGIPAFEVDVPGVNQGKEDVQGFAADESVGHHHVHKARFPDKGRRVPDEFKGKGGFVVSPGHAYISFGSEGAGQTEHILG